MAREHVRRDGARLVAVASGSLDRPVATCPGWRLRDVVRHLAEVYEHRIVCTELRAMPEPWPPVWPAARDPVGWLADAHLCRLAMLVRSGPLAASATWYPPDQTVGVWGRRMAHETVVHRVDGERAVGEETLVDSDLALDGIDEVLAVFLAGDWSEAPLDAGHGQRATIASGGRAWTGALERRHTDLLEADAPAAAAVTGDPAAVMLCLWGRAADDRVALSGDAAAVLRARLTQAPQ